MLIIVIILLIFIVLIIISADTQRKVKEQEALRLGGVQKGEQVTKAETI